MKKYIKLLISILFIYLYLHNPLLKPLGGMGSIKLLYVVTGIIVFTSYASYRSNIVSLRSVLKLLLFSYFYILLRTIITGSFASAYTGTVLIIEEFFVPIALITYLQKKKVCFNDFIRLLLYVGAIGSVITTVCLFFPNVNNYVRENIIVIDENSYLAENLFRGFGISDGLTYAYGIIQGFIFSLGLFNLKANKWFLFFMPLVAISVLVNARTGFVVIIFGFLLYGILNRKITTLFSFVLSLCLLIYTLPLLFGLMEGETAHWINDFFAELESIFKNKNLSDAETFNTLTGRMAIWPDNFIQWIVGRGIYMFGQTSGNNTDVGWFLQLNLGGIVYLFILYNLIKTIYKKMYNYDLSRYLILLGIGTIIIANTKGDFINNTGGFRLLLLISYYCILWKKKIHTS